MNTASSIRPLSSTPSRHQAAPWDEDMVMLSARLRPAVIYPCDVVELPSYIFRSEGFAEDLGSEYAVA